MFHLHDRHCRLPPILPYELLWIVQRPPNFRHDLHVCFTRKPHDLRISPFPIRIRILFEDKVRDAPRLP